MAPNLTQIAQEFNYTNAERDTKLGGYVSIGFFIVGGIAAMLVVSLHQKLFSFQRF